MLSPKTTPAAAELSSSRLKDSTAPFAKVNSCCAPRNARAGPIRRFRPSAKPLPARSPCRVAWSAIPSSERFIEVRMPLNMRSAPSVARPIAPPMPENRRFCRVRVLSISEVARPTAAACRRDPRSTVSVKPSTLRCALRRGALIWSRSSAVSTTRSSAMSRPPSVGYFFLFSSARLSSAHRTSAAAVLTAR